jgi:hypothetical protein
MTAEGQSEEKQTTSPPALKKKSWWFTPLVPYVPQPKGTPWYAVNWGATVFLFGTVIWSGTICLINLANGVPERAQLQIVFGKVIKTQLLTPHLLIELPDGKLKMMELPVNLSMKGGGRAYYGYGWQDEEDRKKFIGCNVEIRGVPMKWTIEDRFRVWELICRDRQIAVGGLESAAKMFDSNQKSNFWLVLFYWLIVPVPLFVAVLYRERKHHHD